MPRSFGKNRGLFFQITHLPVIAAAAVLSARPAHGQNLLIDGGFESPVLTSGQGVNLSAGSTIGTWTVVGSGQITLGRAPASEAQNGVTSFEPEEGSQSIDLTGPNNEGTTDGVTQSFSTTIGQQYLVTFYVGRVTSSTNSGFYSGNAVVDVSINAGSRVSYTNASAGTAGFVDWQQYTTFFTATGSNSSITFYDGTASSNVNYVGLDNVSVTSVQGSAAAPEPAALSLSLPILALSAAVRVRRRSRQGISLS